MIVPGNAIGANDPIRNQITQLIGDVGRAALNAQFPNDFEYYICSLELVDSLGRTVDFFTFPIMPSNMSIVEAKIGTIKKTAGGITTLNTTSFQPVNIQLDGNFGRRLKLLIGTDIVDFAGMKYSTQSGDYGQERIAGTQSKDAVYNTTIKTGYGCVKILQAIYRKANSVDDQGNPFRLYFYNPAAGDSFLVKPMNFQMHQNKQENMIWNYSLSMTGIAPATSSGRSDKQTIGPSIATSILSKGVSNLANNLKGSILNKISPQLI